MNFETLYTQNAEVNFFVYKTGYCYSSTYYRSFTQKAYKMSLEDLKNKLLARGFPYQPKIEQLRSIEFLMSGKEFC